MSAQDQIICFALDSLYARVIARFDAEGVCIPNEFGWREPQKNKRGRERIVWVPGDEGGRIGGIGSATRPGRNPRPIGSILESFTVYLESVDHRNPESEIDQYRATRALLDLWYRAIYLEAHGTITVLSARWDTSKNERRHGGQIICSCVIESPIFDEARAVAPADAGALIALSELDLTETTLVGAGSALATVSGDDIVTTLEDLIVIESIGLPDLITASLDVLQTQDGFEIGAL